VDKTATTYIVLSYPLWLVIEEGGDPMQTKPLSQVLDRVVTIKTRCVVVVLSVMDLHLHQALNRVVTKKNKVHVCGFVCIGSPPGRWRSNVDKTSTTYHAHFRYMHKSNDIW
jgi:hypothetical protein